MARGMGLSWGQRKSLGQRYTTDPAYELEQQRLAEEYAQLPGRRALALSREQVALNDQRNREQIANQQNQFQQTLNAQNDRDQQAGKSSMVGTAGNVAGMYLLQGGGKNIISGAGQVIGAAKNYMYPNQVMPQGLSAIQGADVAIQGADVAIPAVGSSGATGMYSASPAFIETATNTGINTAGLTGTLSGSGAAPASAVDAAAAANTGLLSGTTTAGAETAGMGAGLSSIAIPAAIVGAAFASKGMFGGEQPKGWQGMDAYNKTWENKNEFQKFTSAPASYGIAAQLLPGALTAPKGTFVAKVGETLSSLERMAVKPLDWLFSGGGLFG